MDERDFPVKRKAATIAVLRACVLHKEHQFSMFLQHQSLR